MSSQKSPNITSTITPAYRRMNRSEHHWLKKIALRRKGKKLLKMQRQILDMNPEIHPICVFGSYQQDRAYRNIYRAILPPIMNMPWPDVLHTYIKPMRRPDDFAWNDRSEVKKNKRRTKRRKINEFMRSLRNMSHIDTADLTVDSLYCEASYHKRLDQIAYLDEIEPAYMHIKDMYEY